MVCLFQRLFTPRLCLCNKFRRVSGLTSTPHWCTFSKQQFKHLIFPAVACKGSRLLNDQVTTYRGSGKIGIEREKMGDRVTRAGTSKFVPLGLFSIQPVLNILEDRLPKSAHVYNCVLRHSRHPGEFSIYTLNGEASCSSWVLVVHFEEQLKNSQQISVSAPNNPQITDDIKCAFTHTDAIRWRENMMFNALDRAISRMILDISWLHYGHTTTVFPNYLFIITRKDALKQQLPQIESEEVQLKSLDTEQGAAFITASWKYAVKDTLFYSQEMIRRHPSCGVYVHGKPASAVLTHGHLLIGMLATDPSHRNKGYALLSYKTLLTNLAEEGYVPASSAEQTNTASIKFHEKCGMSVSHECDYIESRASH